MYEYVPLYYIFWTFKNCFTLFWESDHFSFKNFIRIIQIEFRTLQYHTVCKWISSTCLKEKTGKRKSGSAYHRLASRMATKSESSLTYWEWPKRFFPKEIQSMNIFHGKLLRVKRFQWKLFTESNAIDHQFKKLIVRSFRTREHWRTPESYRMSTEQYKSSFSFWKLKSD